MLVHSKIIFCLLQDGCIHMYEPPCSIDQAQRIRARPGPRPRPCKRSWSLDGPELWVSRPSTRYPLETLTFGVQVNASKPEKCTQTASHRRRRGLDTPADAGRENPPIWQRCSLYLRTTTSTIPVGSHQFTERFTIRAYNMITLVVNGLEALRFGSSGELPPS